MIQLYMLFSIWHFKYFKCGVWPSSALYHRTAWLIISVIPKSFSWHFLLGGSVQMGEFLFGLFQHKLLLCLLGKLLLRRACLTLLIFYEEIWMIENLLIWFDFWSAQFCQISINFDLLIFWIFWGFRFVSLPFRSLDYIYHLVSLDYFYHLVLRDFPFCYLHCKDKFPVGLFD